MKIRILGNSIRLRLSQGDIKKLGSDGRIAEKVHFPNHSALTYSLNSGGEEGIQTVFENSEIKIDAPQAFLHEWISTEKVGFDQLLPLPDGATLKILVEKDFKCLTDRNEDESDLFPHPKEDNLNC